MRKLVAEEAGFSILEVVVALVVFSTAVLSLASAGTMATWQMKVSQADTRASKAAQFQLEMITEEGYDDVTGGSSTVQGIPMSWSVTGTNPKKVTLVLQAKDWRGAVVPDTFVTYLADWTP